MNNKNIKHYKDVRPMPTIEDAIDHEISEVEEVIEESEEIDEIASEIDNNLEDAKESVEESKDQSEKVTAVVKCIRLNVRKEPFLESNKIGTLVTGDEITIDLSKSTDCWYKVYTASGLDGYCVKDFVEFKR